MYVHGKNITVFPEIIPKFSLDGKHVQGQNVEESSSILLFHSGTPSSSHREEGKKDTSLRLKREGFFACSNFKKEEGNSSQLGLRFDDGEINPGERTNERRFPPYFGPPSLPPRMLWQRVVFYILFTFSFGIICGEEGKCPWRDFFIHSLFPGNHMRIETLLFPSATFFFAFSDHFPCRLFRFS